MATAKKKIPFSRLVIRAILASATMLVLFFAGSLYYAYLNQGKFIFPGKPYPEAVTYQCPFPFQELNLKAPDGITLNAIHVQADPAALDSGATAPKGVILYFHGNVTYLHEVSEGIAPLLAQLGYDVFAVEYRGYGKSGGTISSQEQVVADARLFYDHLRKSFAAGDILIYGRSIGSGIATQLGKDVPARLMILEAPFYSIREFVSVDGLLRYTFDSGEAVKRIGYPMYIFHSPNDDVIPYEQGKRLAQEAGATLITLEGRGHNRIQSDPAYLMKLREILR